MNLTPVLDTKLADENLERVRRNQADVLKSHERGLLELEARIRRRWAIFHRTTDQTLLGTNGLVEFTHILRKRGDFAVDPLKGMRIPPGCWKLTCGMVATHTLTFSSNVIWYLDPIGKNAEMSWTYLGPKVNTAGMRGFALNTSTTNVNAGGLGTEAIGYMKNTNPTYVGVRIIVSGGTSTVHANWTKAMAEEIDPWDE